MTTRLSTKISNHLKKHKYIYLLAFICLIQILLSGQADLSTYDSNHDVVSYRKMALASPDIDGTVGKPFAFRLLAPWLVGLIFTNVDLGFAILNAIVSILFVLTLFHFLQQNSISKRMAFILSTTFIFNRYFIPNFAYEPYRLADVLSNLLLLLSFIFLAKKNYLLVFLFSVVGVLTREIAMLIIPVGIIFVLQNDKKNISPWFVSFSFLISTFLLFHSVIPAKTGISFDQALSDNWMKIFSPEAIVKQFFLAFSPLFLIPVVSFKEFLNFNKKHNHWIVLLIAVLFASLFGGDKERLMFAYIPIYYLFIAGLLQKLDDKSRIELSVIVAILILSWVSSLHHIWGLIGLPSKEASLAFAVMGGIIILFIFLQLRDERKFKDLK